MCTYYFDEGYNYDKQLRVVVGAIEKKRSDAGLLFSSTYIVSNNVCQTWDFDGPSNGVYYYAPLHGSGDSSNKVGWGGSPKYAWVYVRYNVPKCARNHVYRYNLGKDIMNKVYRKKVQTYDYSKQWIGVTTANALKFSLQQNGHEVTVYFVAHTWRVWWDGFPFPHKEEAYYLDPAVLHTDF